MSYDVVRDFKKIQSFKELQERNAKLVAALKQIQGWSLPDPLRKLVDETLADQQSRAR